MWKGIDTTVGLDTFVGLCNTSYTTDWSRYSLLLKPQTTKCEEHRTISLLVHASKVILRLLTSRMESKAEAFLSNDQFSFRKGVGTREAIAVVRLIGERCIDHEQDVYVCFVDYEKVLNRVHKLGEALESFEIHKN